MFESTKFLENRLDYLRFLRQRAEVREEPLNVKRLELLIMETKGELRHARNVAATA